MRHQHTISREVEIEGRGLFTGESSRLRFKPAPPNTGIWFIRTDQPSPVRIAARVENVSKRARRTTLKNGSTQIETVEHCLSACAALGLDNLQIELRGAEVPAMDGSSLPFLEGLKDGGIEEQEPLVEAYAVADMIRVAEDDAELVALPPLKRNQEHLEIFYDLDYGTDTPIGRQTYRVTVTPEDFETKIAPARTFVLEREVKQLQAMGFGLHLTYQDILVFGEDGPIDNALRFPEECVRHKILDLVGDLSLLGRPIVGRVFARKSGHALNHAMVRALLEHERQQEESARLKRPPVYDIRHIQRLLPHRYPLLMVDRILEIEGSQRAVGLKNVTINEEFFQGHYPGEPIMPGVLIIEAMSQLGGLLLSQELEHKGKVAVLLSLDKVKFRRPVRPGDQLLLEVRSIRARSNVGHVQASARVAGELAAEAEIKFILVDAEPQWGEDAR
ncbi:MAG: hypothetical protein FLDDKLPJ_00082 [Phycisphaerae bacterium]|nr:hypothetical protein [Phycisphaerae bacterium]